MLRLIFVTLIAAGGSLFALRSAFYGLLFYLWFAYFRPDDWTYGGTVASWRLSLWIGAYVVLRTLFSLPNPKISIRTGLIWGFLFQAVIGTYTSENVESSAAFLEDFAKVMIMTYLIVVLVNDRSQFRLVLVVMALSLGFETAKQGWANLILAPGARNENRVAFLGDNNGVALGTMMLLPIIGALAQTSTRKWEGFMHRFVAVGVFLRGISTYSRGGFLGAAVLGVFTIARAQRKFRAVVAAASLALLVWSVMPAGFWQRMETITVEEEEERDSSAAGRLHFWQVAVEMARQNPTTGVGLNGFTLSYPAYNFSQRFPGERAAHSIWFGVLGDLGYPGLILLVGNLVMAVAACWRVGRLCRQRDDMRDLGVYANALISSIMVFCVTGSFLSAHYSEMLWHFIGLSTALLFVAQREHASSSVVPQAKAA